MAEHTPTPWKIGDRKPYVEIWGPMRMNHHPILASMEHEPREENAAFIVKAVNSHGALVRALQALVHQMEDYESVNNLAPNPGRTECWDAVTHAKAVLVSVGCRSTGDQQS